MEPRHSGGSFVLRLLAVLTIPLMGFGFLALDRIDAEDQAASDARDLVDDALVQQSVAAVYGPAQLEEIALAGLAQIDALGLPRSLVVALAGVDFEEEYNGNDVILDATLDRLDEQHGDLLVTGSDGEARPLSERLAAIRAELATQRERNETLSAEPGDIRDIFTDLNQLLADTAATTDVRGASAASESMERRRLVRLGDIQIATGARGKAFLNGLLDSSPESTFAIVAADSSLDDSIERFAAMLDQDERDELNQLTSTLAPLPDAILIERDATLAENLDADYVRTVAGSILDQLHFQTDLELYSNSYHESVVTTLERRAVDAKSAALSTTVGFAVISILSLILLLLISVSMLRPLRRLTRRAAAISDGRFDAEPLPPRGPSDVRTLTRTMNDMMVTLRDLDRQIASLSLDQPIDRRIELPGSIGVSLRRSFEHLESTTAQLHASEQLASAIVAQAADAIWTVDAHGIIRSANEASVKLLGIEARSQIGTQLRTHVSRLNGEVTVHSPTGAETKVLVASSEIDGSGEILTAVIAHDISERARYEERLAYQANHDALTGLPNRFAVLERLGSSPAGEPIAVLFVDLDGFKSINDTQGHLAGDRVLSEVGRRLVGQVRAGDFVGRLGGDEFVVVMHDFDDPSDVVEFGTRLIREIELPHDDGDNVFMLSASVGVATFPTGIDANGLSPIDAIRHSDSAVYAAKRRGRGRVELFDAELQASVVQDAEIEIALRQAVRNDELTLHLQPVLDIASGQFCGAEALVRWQRPEHGIVPPGSFIPVAERSSLIYEIGRWVLNKSCETLARWEREEPGVRRRIAVNIAGSHLVDGNIVADLDNAIARTGADPSLLEFEITETQVMGDIGRATSILHEVRSRGVSVAIDDFGTGYSSMAYLRQLPIDTLKIDRSFVASMIDDDFDSTVLDALLTIGHALGLSVVAEGIEHASQLDYLRSKGCDLAQGFHLARPVPIDEAEQLLRNPAPAFGDQVAGAALIGA